MIVGRITARLNLQNKIYQKSRLNFYSNFKTSKLDCE